MSARWICQPSRHEDLGSGAGRLRVGSGPDRGRAGAQHGMHLLWLGGRLRAAGPHGAGLSALSLP
jgi:hypothetical protein